LFRLEAPEQDFATGNFVAEVIVMSSLFGRAPGERRKSGSAGAAAAGWSMAFSRAAPQDGRRRLADPAGPGRGALAGF